MVANQHQNPQVEKVRAIKLNCIYACRLTHAATHTAYAHTHTHMQTEHVSYEQSFCLCSGFVVVLVVVLAVCVFIEIKLFVLNFTAANCRSACVCVPGRECVCVLVCEFLLPHCTLVNVMLPHTFCTRQNTEIPLL